MSPNEPLPPDLEEIENLLGQLQPKDCAVDTDALLAQVEQPISVSSTSVVSARRPIFWQCATAVLLLLSLGLGYRLAQKPAVEIVYRDRIVTPPKPEQKTPVIVENSQPEPESNPNVKPGNLDKFPPLPVDSFLRMRQTVFVAGVDALPNSPLPANHPDVDPPSAFEGKWELPEQPPRPRWNELFPLNFGDVL